MKRLQNKTNVTAPNAQFPYGAVKDNTGTNNGTPVNVDTYGDMHQFFEKLFAESGLTANGLPDDANNGFQLYQALITAGNYAFAQDIIKGLIGSYTTDDLIVLWGCTVYPTIPGSSTITTGAIFYNGIIYKVPAATVVTISGETLVFKINATVQPGTIYLTNGTAGSGIANYNQSSVKSFQTLPPYENVSGNIISGLKDYDNTTNLTMVSTLVNAVNPFNSKVTQLNVTLNITVSAGLASHLLSESDQTSQVYVKLQNGYKSSKISQAIPSVGTSAIHITTLRRGVIYLTTDSSGDLVVNIPRLDSTIVSGETLNLSFSCVLEH